MGYHYVGEFFIPLFSNVYFTIAPPKLAPFSCAYRIAISDDKLGCRMFEKLFGRSKTDVPAPNREPSASVADPAKNPNLVRVYDAYGREMYITRDAWRTSILPDAIKKQWDNPGQLYSVLVQALADGFQKDIGPAVQHLYEIDPDHGRAACLWAIYLMKEGNLSESEAVLTRALKKVGEQGYLLTNLAKVYAAQMDHQRADQTLWRALEADPNQDNAFSWYWAREKDANGEDAGIAAVRRVSQIDGSWRAQLWLARLELAKGNLTSALALYREAILHGPKPIPTDLLMQMSGDLGNQGHLSDLLALAEPYFVPDIHGLLVGNNLIKAHLDLDQLDAAQSILDKLYALNRPDYQQNLRFWDTEIAKARVEKAVAPKSASFEMLSVEGPVWLVPNSEGSSLFLNKDTNTDAFAVIGGTAEIANPSETVKMQLADTVGRLTRALPLFIAEQIGLRTTAHATTLVPWIVENHGASFVLNGNRWSDKDVIELARRNAARNRYVVTLHLKSAQEPWSVDVRVLRVQDERLLRSFSHTLDETRLEASIPKLTGDLIASLVDQNLAQSVEPSPLYKVPEGCHFADYLLRLEQLLALRCASMETTPRGFLNNEREIIEGNIGLCADYPHNFTLRLLLAKSLLALSRVRPDIMPEFETKLAVLGRDQPMDAECQKVIDAVIAKAISK